MAGHGGWRLEEREEGAARKGSTHSDHLENGQLLIANHQGNEGREDGQRALPDGGGRRAEEFNPDDIPEVRTKEL